MPGGMPGGMPIGGRMPGGGILQGQSNGTVGQSSGAAVSAVAGERLGVDEGGKRGAGNRGTRLARME